MYRTAKFAAVLVLCLLLLAGCLPRKQSITEVGSTTVLPVAERLAGAFMDKNPKVRVNTQGGGSSVGIKSVANGTADIGASSRPLEGAEQELGLTVHEIAKDSLAVIVHPENPLNELSLADLRRIFSGEVSDWSAFGGNGPITLIMREEGSGTREVFQKKVMQETQLRKEAVSLGSNGAIKTAVSGDVNAIGYIGLGYIDDSVKPISIDGVAPTTQTAQSGSYPLVRSLYFVTKGEPKGLVKEFLNFALGKEGQTLIADEGYLPLANNG